MVSHSYLINVPSSVLIPMVAAAAIVAHACAPAGSVDAPPRVHPTQPRALSETAGNPIRPVKPSQSLTPITKPMAELPLNPGTGCPDADACLDLARQWDRGLTGPRDPQEARRYYALACEGGSPVACNNLGAMIMREEGASRSQKLAFSLFREACRGEDSRGCYNAGLCYEWGSGVEQNFIASLSSYEKACTLGMTRACRQVAALKTWNWDFALLRGGPRSDAQSAEP